MVSFVKIFCIARERFKPCGCEIAWNLCTPNEKAVTSELLCITQLTFFSVTGVSFVLCSVLSLARYFCPYRVNRSIALQICSQLWVPGSLRLSLASQFSQESSRFSDFLKSFVVKLSSCCMLVWSLWIASWNQIFVQTWYKIIWNNKSRTASRKLCILPNRRWIDGFVTIVLTLISFQIQCYCSVPVTWELPRTEIWLVTEWYNLAHVVLSLVKLTICFVLTLCIMQISLYFFCNICICSSSRIKYLQIF